MPTGEARLAGALRGVKIHLFRLRPEPHEGSAKNRRLDLSDDRPAGGSMVIND